MSDKYSCEGCKRKLDDAHVLFCEEGDCTAPICVDCAQVHDGNVLCPICYKEAVAKERLDTLART